MAIDVVKVKGVCALVVLIAWLIIMVLLSGCNMYNVKRCVEVGGELVCSEANIKSMRKFKHIAFKYNRDTGAFELEASDVANDNSTIETLANVILLQTSGKQAE